MSTFSHTTVLLHETVALLKAGQGKLIVDGTLGGGGHSEALLRAGARVLGIDRDPLALAAASARLAQFGTNFRAVQGEFGDAVQLAGEPVDGFVLDLGVSSPQLDEAERGFSFMKDGPLDMRMADSGETAAELIERVGEQDLADLIYRYGEERFSRPIAKALKLRRPQRTFEAVEAIKAAVPRKAWPRETHVATRTFQALRIAVNGELDQLGRALDRLPTLLKSGGVAAIISFHSLEDRAVKQTFRKLCGEGGDDMPRGLPVATTREATFRALTKKPITASAHEAQANVRARSAKLRGVEKLP